MDKRSNLPISALRQELFNRCVNKELTPYFVDGYHSLRPIFGDPVLSDYKIGMVGFMNFRGQPMESAKAGANGLSYNDFNYKEHALNSTSQSMIVDCYEQDGVFIVEMLNGDLLTNINFSDEWRTYVAREQLKEIAHLLCDCAKDANGSLSYGRTKALVEELKERRCFSQCEYGEGFFDKKVLSQIAKAISDKMQEMGIETPSDITKDNYYRLTNAASSAFENAINDRINAVYHNWAMRCVELQKPIHIMAHGMRMNSAGIDAPMIMHGSEPEYFLNGKTTTLDKIRKGSEVDCRLYVKTLQNGELGQSHYIDLHSTHLIDINQIDNMGEFKGATFIELDNCVIVSANIVNELKELAINGMAHKDIIIPEQEIEQNHDEEIDRRQVNTMSSRRKEIAEYCAQNYIDPILMDNINWDSLSIIDEYGNAQAASIEDIQPGMTISLKYEAIDMLSAVPQEKEAFEMVIDEIWRDDNGIAFRSGDSVMSSFDFTRDYLSQMTNREAPEHTIDMQQDKAVKQQTQSVDVTQSLQMTDYQKLQMTQVSYLDFTSIEQVRGMKLEDARGYLDNPDLWSMGAQFNNNDAAISNKLANGVVKGVIGQEAYTTDGQLYQQCLDSGLGDLRIKDIANDPETGFQAMALEDSAGNTYISFRGSDGDFSKGMMQDWYRADGVEFLEGDQGPQVKQALEFFDKNKSTNGENHIYGHSLGGNLTSHVFAQRENEINSAFCYNANPIDAKYLDTQEKQEAFQSERFTFAAVEGDVVSGLKDVSAYQNRVVYVANSEQGNGNILNHHLAEAASFDKNGNFIQSTKEQYMARQGEGAQSVLSFAHNAKDWINNHEETAKALIQVCEGQWPTNLDAVMKELGPEAKEWLSALKDEWTNQLNLDMDLSKMFELENMFPAAKVAEMVTGKDIIPDMNLGDIFLGEDQQLDEIVPQLVMGGGIGAAVKDIDVADVLYDVSQEIEDMAGGIMGGIAGAFDFGQEEDELEEALDLTRGGR